MKATWLEDDGPLSTDELLKHNVYYAALPTQPELFQGAINVLMNERGYVQQDEVALAPSTPNIEVIRAKFVDEHFHDDDEVRFVLEGEGIFDIRSRDDRWMRVVVQPGDLIVVPAQRHHRFMLTDTKTIRCVRLFKDAAGWVPHYREELPA
jgi:1,2-dihydroxy-3-keto-5-methylthiopentene dioxygenase